MKKRAICLLFVVIFTFAFQSFSVFAADDYKGYDASAKGVKIESKTALLYSIDTDDIMFSKNADVKRYPASLTKLMTAYVVVKNCKNLNEVVTVDSDWFEELLGSGSTVANLKDGEEITVRNLLHMMLISSAADASDVLAVYTGGSFDKFVDMMNNEAKALKMDSSHFMNPHGLHDDNHYTTAADLLKLSKAVLKMPVIKEICTLSSYTVPATNKSGERDLVTTNLMQNASTDYYYKYARGMKTGFTTPAGRCLISTASYKGYNYLCIILGGDDDTRSEYSDSKALYRWAFLNFEYRKIADITEIIDEVQVNLSWDADHVQLYPEKTVSAIVPCEIDNSSIIYDAVLAADAVNAPIKKGQVLGYAKVICANREITRVNLVAGEDVERSIVLLIKQTAIDIVGSTPFKFAALVLVVLIIAVIIVYVIHSKRKRSGRKKVTRIRKY